MQWELQSSLLSGSGKPDDIKEYLATGHMPTSAMRGFRGMGMTSVHTEEEGVKHLPFKLNF